MKQIEKYFGIKVEKRISEKKLERHSRRYKARLEESNILKQTNELFAKGNSLQCFGLLQKAVKLVPNDYKPYYLLGLIHEENENFVKASKAYMVAAVLKKNDMSLWKKVLLISSKANRLENEILALSKISRKEPSEELTIRKMNLMKQMNKKYSVIACQIELFDYQGVNNKIFEKFEKTRHISSLKKVCSSLYRCIKRNQTARTEYFLRKTAFNMYKIKDWNRILKILDEFYFKECEVIHPDIRVLYILASLNSGEYRIDPLLSIAKLVEEDAIWKGLENEFFLHDLCLLLKDKSKTDQAICLIDKLLSSRETIQNILFAADFYHQIGDVEGSIHLYNRAVELDPTNPEPKSKLHTIYSQIGLKEEAKDFETHKIVSEYLKQSEDSTKAVFRYSTEKCKQMREFYDILISTPTQEYEQFILNSEILLDDFFKNPFVVIKNKNFRSFTNKNEKLNLNEAKDLVVINENITKRQLTEKLIRISSLHGLDIDEWFFIVKNSIFSLMALQRFEEAKQLALESLNAFIFKENSEIMMQLFLISIRLCLMSQDLDTILMIFKEIIQLYGYNSLYLLYFLIQFFPDFYMNKQFCYLQKNVQRIMRRSVNEIQENSRHRETDISEFLALSSFLPRFLQTETVDFINSSVKSSSSKVNTMKAIVSITHTKSRTLYDKKPYATAGIKLLKDIPDDDFVKIYNLAKSYHFFGYYTHAELLYYRVIDNGPMELKRMSIFNLSLIFKHNKSKAVQRSLLSKV